MVERVTGTITRYNMFRPGDRVGVAVSGGADSIFLLYILREISARWNLHLSVVHVEHGIRGEESRGDAAFVRELAAGLGYPFHLREVNVAAAVRDGGNLEQAAREARHAFFRLLLENGVLSRIALGHTRSDQAETVLFRFLRGSGSAGLAGVRPLTALGIVRPLLDLERSEIEAWLRERGIRWREDSTNGDPSYDRNRIRLELLPQLLREWNPGLIRTLAQTADWALEEEAYWDGEIARLSTEYLVLRPPAALIRCGTLRDMPVAAARRLVRRAVELVRGDLRSVEFHHICAILELVSTSEGHGRLQIPGADVLRSFEWLRLAPPVDEDLDDRNYCFPLPVPGRVKLPGSESAIHVEIVENSGYSSSLASVYNNCVGFLDWECLSGSLEVRNWRPGDQYRPVGHTSDQKVKNLFQQARIPQWDRRHWPIISDGKQILWARSFGAAAAVAVRDTSRKVLVVRETEG